MSDLQLQQLEGAWNDENARGSRACRPYNTTRQSGPADLVLYDWICAVPQLHCWHSYHTTESGLASLEKLTQPRISGITYGSYGAPANNIFMSLDIV